ncbi:MAG TPA: protease inhibitor I42 family protein [Chloroflexota bacterium]|nr:protease inhibitor I42 family protein [Chloroflexota bacterium]
MVTLDQTASGTEIAVRPEELIVVNLRETPTTGFRWTLVSQGEPACTLDHDTFEPKNDGAGRGGTRRWTFRASPAGRGTIELAERRPWERDEPPVQTFTLGVRVDVHA